MGETYLPKMVQWRNLERKKGDVVMTQYYESLKLVCENCLINLYLEVADNPRFTPLSTRSQIIKKFIKPKIKLQQYKLIKKELKRLSLAKEHVPLETELQKLLVNLTQYKGKGDAEALLFDYLGNLYDWTGLMIQISTSQTVAEPGNIYLCKDETFNKLSSDGQYLEPINLFVYCETEAELDEVLSKAADDSRFTVSVAQRHSSHAKLDVLPR